MTSEPKKPFLRRPFVLAMAAIAAVLIALMLLPEDEPETDTAAPAEVVMQLLPSEIHEVRQGALRDTVQLTGSLVPGRELTISAEVSGRIETLDVREGQQVRKGDELASIDVRALRNQLEQQQATAEATRAQLELARAQLARTTSLVGRGAASSSALDTETANVAQSEANYAALLKQVAIAEDDLSKARILAPFDGIIASRSANPGAFVSPGSEMLELVDISSLLLEGGIPVNYGPRLRAGQGVTVRVDGIADRIFVGKIDRIAPIAVAGTRVLPVYAALDNPDGVLRGGMFATGDLVLEEAADGIGVPAAAIRTEAGQPYVLRVNGDRAERRDVTVVRHWNRGRTAEVTGIEAGDLIVSQPMERLVDGMRVNRIGG